MLGRCGRRRVEKVEGSVSRLPAHIRKKLLCLRILSGISVMGWFEFRWHLRPSGKHRRRKTPTDLDWGGVVFAFGSGCREVGIAAPREGKLAHSTV